MRRKIGGFILRVNPILCDGFGHCHELAPELVTMDEWGYLSDLGAIESARYAVRGCPRQALRIERMSESA
jgi:ferredoxin